MIMIEKWTHEIKKLIIFASFIVLCFWKFDVVADFFRSVLYIIFPFLLGGAIAFILGIPMGFIEKKLFQAIERPLMRKEKSEKRFVQKLKKIKRPISLMIVVFLLLFVIAEIFVFLIPQLIETSGQLGERMEDTIQKVHEYVQFHFQNSEMFLMLIDRMKLDSDRLLNFTLTFLQKSSNYAIQDMMNLFRKIVSGTTTFLIAVVFACYVLLQKERLKIQAKMALYAFVEKGKADAVCEVFVLAYETFAGFLAGQCLEAVILGTMFMFAMSILQIPYAVLISIVIGFTALVPVFGSIVGFMIGFLLIIIADPMKALTFTVLFFVLQQIEGNLIYPHVVGNSVGLPSIWVFSAVTIGGRLLGVVGMLIFIPLASVIYALLREIIKILHRKRHVEHLFGENHL